MTTYLGSNWFKEYALPTLLVLAIGPVWVAIWGDLNLLAFGLAFALAFVTGGILWPERAWVMPTAVVLVMLAVVYLLEMLGLSEPDRADLIGNLLLIPALALIVGLPLMLCTWAGRELRRTLGPPTRRPFGPRTPAL